MIQTYYIDDRLFTKKEKFRIKLEAAIVRLIKTFMFMWIVWVSAIIISQTVETDSRNVIIVLLLFFIGYNKFGNGQPKF